MDPFSVAASAISVVALAAQVADGVRKLHNFFAAVRDAPAHLSGIQTSLSTLAAVLAQLQTEFRLSHQPPSNFDDENLTLRLALLECMGRLREVDALTQRLSTGLAAGQRLARTLASAKAVGHTKTLAQIEKRLEAAKSTLSLALHTEARRSQIVHHTEQRLALAEVVHHIRSKPKLESAVVESNADRHARACINEARDFAAVVNPWMRGRIETVLQQAIEENLAPFLEERSLNASTDTSQPVAKITTASTKYTMKSRLNRQTTTKSVFGTVTIRTDAIFRVAAKSDSRTRNCCDGDDDDFDHFPSEKFPGQAERIYRTRFCVVPPAWLSWFGMSKVLDISLEQSSHTGWKAALNAPRLLPDNAPIFEFCASGDLPGVRDLLMNGKASVIDVDSSGSTPLHIAAASHHPAVCQLLIAHNANIFARDWDSWEQTPLGQAGYMPRSRRGCLSLTYKEDPNSESRQIQTFRRLIEAGYNLEMEEEEQLLRITSFGNKEALDRRGGSRLNFEYPSQWLLKQMMSDVLENPRWYDSEFWRSRLSESILRTPGDYHTREILRYCSPEAIRDSIMSWARLRFFYTEDNRDADLRSLRDMLAALGPNTSLDFTRPHCRRPDELSTPTREAMGNSRTFREWVKVLAALEYDIDAFAAAEAPLVDDGWDSSALAALLRDDYVHPDNTEYEHRCCGRMPSLVVIDWEPLWELRKARIRTGRDVDGPLDEAELRTHKKWERYEWLMKEHGLCLRHQREWAENGKLDELLGEAGHPGLLEVEI